MEETQWGWGGETGTLTIQANQGEKGGKERVKNKEVFTVVVSLKVQQQHPHTPGDLFPKAKLLRSEV